MQHLRLYALWLDLELIAVLLYVTSQRGSLSFSNSFKRLFALFTQPSHLAFPGLPSFFISWILVLMHVFFVVILCALYSPLLPYMQWSNYQKISKGAHTIVNANEAMLLITGGSRT